MSTRYPTLADAQAAGVSMVGGIPVEAYFNMPAGQRAPRYTGTSGTPVTPGGTTPGGLLSEAANAARSAGRGYSARTTSAPVVEAQLMRDQNLQPYMNPYTQQVTQNALGDLERQRTMALEGNDAQAMQAGAFGGARHGVMGAETNRAYFDQMADTSAQLNQANFANAQGMAGRDVGAMNNMAQFNASNLMNANLANMSAQNSAGQFNAGQAMQSAGLLGNLAGQQFGMQNTANQNLANDGAMQRALMQNMMNNVRGQFQQYANWPMNSINPIMSTLGGIPGQGGTSTTTQNPGLFGTLATLASF